MSKPKMGNQPSSKKIKILTRSRSLCNDVKGAYPKITMMGRVDRNTKDVPDFVIAYTDDYSEELVNKFDIFFNTVDSETKHNIGMIIDNDQKVYYV